MKTWVKDSLRVCQLDTRAEMGRFAAKEAGAAIRAAIEKKGRIRMIFAAAPSQNEFLKALVEDEGIDWTRVHAFHMDEYVGLDPAAPQGFGNFLRRALFDRAPFASVEYINGNAPDLDEECRRYSSLLQQAPIDVVCMGIGENGHIAFNDPHVAFFDDPSLVKVVELDGKCRQQQVNDGCFASLDLVPTHALTLTIPALVAGEKLFCVVPASTKAEAVQKTVNGPVEEACPASILRKHSAAALYIDRDSAALLKE